MADTNALPLAYVEMTQPQADANYGKLRVGQVIAVHPDQAAKLIQIGVAEESTQAAYDQYRNQRVERVAARHSRAGEFAALNQESAATWDASTFRDVTMAPEEGIRQAFAAGGAARLVNTQLLTDEDGNPLPQDAGLEEILEARSRLDYAESPYTGHERSSVSGGGSHTYPVGTPHTANEFSTLGDAKPLNAPSHKLTAEQLGNGPDDGSDDVSPKGRRKK